MSHRTPLCRIVVFAALVVAAAARPVAAAGFALGASKDELKLQYDVAVSDHGTGRVTVVLTLQDAGRLEPLDEVQLAIPAKEKNADGGRWMDLSVMIEMRKTDDGKRVGRIHIRKDWAERAEIWLNTHTMDGKVDPFTRLHHVIPVAKYLTPPAAAPAATPAAAPAAEPLPSTEKK